MDNLELMKHTDTARREIVASTWTGAIRTAAAFLKELAHGEPLGLQYVEPLDVNQEEKPPFVQGTELDDKSGCNTLRVTIKSLDTAPFENCARYELQFTRYTLDEARLKNAARR
ncbi:MAG: hypothetical protein SOU49_12380 [Sodaliphilus pleomorphus]|uniref:hypothetical protein n=1 Tax=Sodaliphilus pleomorphus TaxID=2606626 RepID=UPI0023F2C0E9|nr:hypothetical protein [Sodaliphilus pleomorphus]MDD7065202.1 hypothetical protein [Sodaliphilus pleomorphus]MDY2833517.1 hypothetical protein [Sodaliphilus pleomorphus]